jgi:hypothetical protein
MGRHGSDPGGLFMSRARTLWGTTMRGISQLRRGRSIQSRAKRARLRRAQPRYAGKSIRSDFKAAPRKPKPTQPYLGTNVDVADLLS